ncbi:hypothetical protein MW7_002555 [Imbroritus primus]|uniref:Uncharacterized protein n=1 Tax=Imbroritus primus TaxID=3058603 RepID=A0ACD3SU78_9BURK|nr:hypothetical protein MW7_002555 [Burkholderiaceae bacterium PBA]
MSNPELSVEEAYRAMFYFLEHTYHQDVADGFETEMATLPWRILESARGTVDPIAWQDWLNAVAKAKTIPENVWTLVH